MVCATKEYVAGKRFYMSDHFALYGLLDVHPVFGALGGGVSAVADKRREVLGGLRTASAQSERVRKDEKERAGERALALEADREDQRNLARQRKKAAKARKEREEKCRKDREEVFGAGSLFAIASDVVKPPAPIDLGVRALP